MFPQEHVVGRVVPPRDVRTGRRREEVVLHELDDEGDVDVDRALELRERADVARGHLEVRVLLEAFRGNDVPEEVDHLLALGRDLHLHDRVEEEVPPVLA